MAKKTSNTVIAVEWLWSHRCENNWWVHSVLTKANPDSTSPKLTDVEAISIFKMLKDNGLLIDSTHEGCPVYLIHVAKEREWKNLISELKGNRPRSSGAKSESISVTKKETMPNETKLQWWVKTLLGTGGLLGAGAAIWVGLHNRPGGNTEPKIQNSNNSGPTFNTVGNSNTIVNNTTTTIITTQAQAAKPSIQEQLMHNARTAYARSWQPQAIPPDVKVAWVKFGGMAVMYTMLELTQEAEPMARAVFPGGDTCFTPFVRSNRLYVKALTPFGRSNQKPLLMNSEWSPQLPDGWDQNYDATSFEIVDDTKLPVFQVRYQNPFFVEIYGAFVSTNGAITIAFGNYVESYPPELVAQSGFNLPNIAQRKAWFRYPSSDFLMKRAE